MDNGVRFWDVVSKEDLSGGSGEPEGSPHQSQPEPRQPEERRPRFGGASISKWLEERIRKSQQELHDGSLSKHESGVTYVSGRTDFDYRRDLSEDGQKLYRLVLGGVIHRKDLPLWAEEEGFDLNGAMDELRNHGLIDESDPDVVKRARRRLS